MRIAFIPARGGSKRVPGKNIRPMNGKPLIAWAIDACRESGLFEHILVSTDSPEIAAVAVAHGAKAPFLRPEELAGDHVATAPVREHALAWATKHWGYIDIYCQLYANPFITPDNLVKGLEMLVASEADRVLAVAEFPFPVLRSFRLDKQGGVDYAFPEFKGARSQDLPVFYHDAGQFYWDRNRPSHDGYLALPLVLPRSMVVDIDTEEDWHIAEQLHGLFLQKGRARQSSTTTNSANE